MPTPVATRAELAGRIDQSLLRAGATRDEVLALCDESARLGFHAVCVNPSWVRVAAARLGGGGPAVCSTVGFPLGAAVREVKLLEARRAIEDGASEIDLVIDLGAIRSGDLGAVRREVEEAAAVCRERRALLKAIIEASLLDGPQKEAACRIAKECGADFVKTSTGFGPGGATAEDVRLIARLVGPGLGVKAAGGIRTLASALAMIEAGATRIGTSAGAAILEEMR